MVLLRFVSLYLFFVRGEDVVVFPSYSYTYETCCMGHNSVGVLCCSRRFRLVDGIRTLLRLGFTEIASTAPSKQRHFIIRVDESGLPFILQYKEALQKAQSKGEK